LGHSIVVNAEMRRGAANPKIRAELERGATRALFHDADAKLKIILLIKD